VFMIGTGEGYKGSNTPSCPAGP